MADFAQGQQNLQLKKLITFLNSPEVGVTVTQFWLMRLKWKIDGYNFQESYGCPSCYSLPEIQM